MLSVNVGQPTQIGTTRRGEPVYSGIVKTPIVGSVRVRGVNIHGDEQADRRSHGGPDKAVYAYASEDATWWARKLGRELPPGGLGENLTTRGVDCSGAVIGERWRVGSVLLEVAQPRTPCYKLGLLWGDPKMVRTFARAGRPGVYMRILEEGELSAGDTVELVERPDHGVTVALVANALVFDHSLRARAAEAPRLPERIRERLRRGESWSE